MNNKHLSDDPCRTPTLQVNYISLHKLYQQHILNAKH